jgi:hypothetical protein
VAATAKERVTNIAAAISGSLSTAIYYLLATEIDATAASTALPLITQELEGYIYI